MSGLCRPSVRRVVGTIADDEQCAAAKARQDGVSKREERGGKGGEELGMALLQISMESSPPCLPFKYRETDILST